MKKLIIQSAVVLTVFVSVLCGCGSESKNKYANLDDVANYLKEKKLISGNKMNMQASMIGAMSGIKYENSQVELYLYDINSDAYKGIVSNNKVKIESLDMELEPSAVNGKFVIFCENAENKDQIINAFKEISAK